MKRMNLIVGIIFSLLAIIVFVFADGLRRWYSGVFFAIIAVVMILNAMGWRNIGNK